MRRQFAFLPTGDGFPFEFGWQAMASPTGESISLEVRDVCYRGIGIARLPAGVSKLFVIAPIKRRTNGVFPYPAPSVRKPQGRRIVSAVGYEFIPFAIGDKSRGQSERFEENAVSRSLVVEGEPVCLMTYPRDAAGVRMPIVRAGMRFCCRYIPHLHAKRVLKQGVFDIG